MYLRAEFYDILQRAKDLGLDLVLALYDLLRNSEVLFFWLNVKGKITGSLKRHLEMMISHETRQ